MDQLELNVHPAGCHGIDLRIVYAIWVPIIFAGLMISWFIIFYLKFPVIVPLTSLLFLLFFDHRCLLFDEYLVFLLFLYFLVNDNDYNDSDNHNEKDTQGYDNDEYPQS